MRIVQRIARRLIQFRRMLVFRYVLTDWQTAWNDYRSRRCGTTLKLRNGYVISGRKHDDVVGIFSEIFADQCYTPRWFYRPRSGDVVLDVGANIGLFSIYLSSITPGVIIHAFEPHPETFSQLKDNLAANKLVNVTAHQLAIDRNDGIVYFLQPTTGEFGHVAIAADGCGPSAKSATLSNAVQMTGSNKIELLKIDTEGAEVEIVEGAPYELWQRIRRVVVEFHTLEKRDAVLTCLKAHFRCHVVPTPGYEHHLGLIFAAR